MATAETPLERATRHVHSGREIVARQLQLIGRMRALGHDCTEAMALLDRFERTQAIFEADLGDLLSKQNSGSAR